jgi:hypothetical protein
LVCHRRHGRAPAAPPRNRRRQHHGFYRCRRPRRPGAGCGATGWIGVFRATSCGSPSGIARSSSLRAPSERHSGTTIV